MVSDRALMRMHVEALFTHDAGGRMRHVNEPGGQVAPRFFLGRTAEGNEWRFRHDLPDELVRELEALCANEPAGAELSASDRATAYAGVLARHAPVQRLWTGPAYRFPREVPAPAGTVLVTEENADVLRPHLEAWLGDVSREVPFAAVLDEGRAVSVCCSVRVTPDAHEAGVETHPDFRRRGYAARAVAAWAIAVRRIGCIPLYSTSWANAASRALAAKLGLVQYGSDLHMT